MKTPVRNTVKQTLAYFKIDIETLSEVELREWYSNITTAKDLTENELLVLKYLTPPHHANTPTNVDTTVRSLFNKGLVEATLIPTPITGVTLTTKGHRILEILSYFNTLSIGILKHSSDNIPTPPIHRVKPGLRLSDVIIGKIYRNALGQDLKVLNLAKQLIDGNACDVVIYSVNNQLPAWVAEYKEFVKDTVPMKEVSVDSLTSMEIDKLVAELQDIPWAGTYQPTINWAQGGPIIETVGIELHLPSGYWVAEKGDLLYKSYNALEAAMRVYVAIRLGKTVIVPDLD